MTKKIVLSLALAASFSLAACSKSEEAAVNNAAENTMAAAENTMNAAGNAMDNMANAAGAMANGSNAQ